MSTAYELADCPACGATEHRELADRDDIRAQVERLWGFHLRRLRPGTPLHRLTDRLVFSQRPPVRLVECPGCGTVYRDPRERERLLLELYADETPSGEALEALFEAQLPFYRERVERLTRVAGRAGRGVEVGSYVGAFLAAAQEHGWAFTGLDVNEATNDFIRGRGFRVRTGTADDLDGEGAGLDAIVLWNCFDQLPDPRATLRRVRARLRPGGAIALRVPNGALYAACARSGEVGPAGAWVLALNNLLGFPYRHGFTPDSLRRLLADAGFDVVDVRRDTLVRLAGPWTRWWAAWEERIGLAGMKALLPRRLAPWVEIYALRS